MEINDLLECGLQILGRAVIPPSKVRKIIREKNKKQIQAFNLCDGTLTVTEIAKKCRLNQGNLSRTMAMWCENGIAFKIGNGKNARFRHLYPLPKKDEPA